jgi:superfamily I DNA/RNA helicase
VQELDSIRAVATDREWSDQQLAIFKEFRDGKRHAIVRARAGTGKTTTIIRGIDFAPEKSIVMCAFNNRIAKELVNRLRNPRAQAKTLHSIGYGIVRRNWNLGVESDSQRGERADGLAAAVCGPTTPDTIVRLVSKLHTKGREIVPHARRFEDLEDLAYRFDCEPDDTWEDQGYDTPYVVQKGLEAMDLAARVRPAFIDFADMIFLPCRNRWLVKQFDLVVVDEMQDMTSAQLEIARGICRGRVIGVGDDKQAIYAFRGADSNSLDRLKVELNAAEYPLNRTYRCGKKIVELAQHLVPDFEANEANPDGEVKDLEFSKLVAEAQHGDFILSRLNAPIVGIALSLLRQNKRARVAGRDIGKGLITLVRKLSKGRQSIEELLERVNIWMEREKAKWMAANKPDRAEQIGDQANMIIELTEGTVQVQEVVQRIESLFTDDGLGAAGIITCSSVHRSKGLEAQRVFVLQDTLRDWNQEESNIRYVAITRAIGNLFMVKGL